MNHPSSPRGFRHPLCWIIPLFLCVAGLAQNYSLDANGWSIITPSSDSRLIYVSAAGNDSTAQTYTTAQVGADPRSPSISVNAYKTLSAAYAQMRAGYPDWVIFRRGDTFTDSITFGGNTKGGRNASERWLFTYYGASGNRPLLTAANWDFYGSSAHIALVGLDVHYRRRDPTSTFWVNFTSEFKVIFSAAINSSAGNILLEDCVFRNGQENLVIQGISSGSRLPNVDVRRCAVWDANDGTGTTAHDDRSQGIYGAWLQDLVIEECFFDRNGWNQNSNGTLAGKGRSIYSHNIYLQNGSRNTTIRDNIISRASANGLQARAGNYVDNNLLILNAVGLFSESATSQGEDVDNIVIDNVLIAGDDIAPSVWTGSDVGVRGWGIEVHRMPSGLYEGNIMLDEVSSGSPFAMQLKAGSGSQTIPVRDNIVRNWGIGIQNQDPGSYTLSNNIVNGVNQSTSQPVTFVDGSRTLSTYLSSIGSSGDNLAFLANARAAWIGAPRTFPNNYRANTVNNYFRAGFTISGSNSVPNITTTSLPAGTQGTSYSQTLLATGGNGTLVWSLASGSLPAGLNLSSAGVISGTPTGTGTSNFTVRVADSDGITGSSDEDTQALTLQVNASSNSVPNITTTSLPGATQGNSYSQTLQATGGNGALVWSLASGTLPSGLSLSSAGIISGAPSGTGTSNFTVRVADSDGITGSSDEDTQALTIVVSGSANSVPNITTTSLPNGSRGTAYSQTLAASGGNGTLVWSLASGSLPPGLSLSSAGVISGTPTVATAKTFTVRVADSDGVTGSADEDTQSLTVTILDSGLRVWLRLNETSGTSATDSSGNGANGTLVNGPTWAAGQNGNGVNLDGTNDHVTLPSTGLANFTSGLTISLWAKVDNVTDYARFVDIGVGQSNQNIWLGRVGTTTNLGFKVYNGTAGGTQVTAAGAISTGTWQHFAVTQTSSGSVVIYKNGAQVATGSTTVPVNVTRAANYLGRSNWSSNAYLDGMLDDVRIYNRTLTATEVALVYNNP